MALSFTTVQAAYKVLHKIKQNVLPELNIKSFLEDMENWDLTKKENPPLNELLGFGKKSDDGWEALVFYVENPTYNLINAFNDYNTIKSNSCISERHTRIKRNVWVFGWF